MLEALLTPKTVAVVGASRIPGKVGYEIVFNLKESGFAGEIILINPSAGEVCGIKCYPNLASSGKSMDMAVIAIPAARVKGAVDECISAGVKTITIVSAGFKEVGDAGAELEREIVTTCKSHGVRLLGPNCLGLINVHHRMNASFARHIPKPGGISVISQSGALCTAILDWAASRGLGLAKLISLGNKADLSEVDFLRALAEDDQTSVIVGYLENIASGDRFMKAAESASSQKPVVMLKAGVTRAGGRAASSHTGSLAGGDIAYGAAFKRCGIIRADTFESLFDRAMALAMQPLPKGNRVAIITNAGGPGIMAADAVELAGMEVCALQGASAAALRNKLPTAASVGNPIDVLGDADPGRYTAAVRTAQDDDSVDAIIVILTPQAMTLPLETARAIIRCIDKRKPVLASFMGGMDVATGREELIASNMPDYPAPERAVAALKAMCDYAAWLKRPPRVVVRFPVNKRRVERIVNRHLKTREFQVGEAQAKAILRAYHFNVPQGAIAETREKAVDVAEKIGFPVAMKIASRDIIHKSDIGGVRLNLDSADALRDAFDLMMLRVRERLPNARIEGVYVEKMCGRGREVILGMTRDPQFGPMLMFGLGGIFVEVMKDVSFHIAPITKDDAIHMLEGTRSFALLKGVRGEAELDISSIAVALQRISQLATDFKQITEMDINPFIVAPVGAESVAADARITLREA